MPSSSISLTVSEPQLRPSPPLGPEPELELRDLFLVLRRHSRLIAACALLGGFGAGLHAFTAKKQYSATATIAINAPAAPALGLDDLSGSRGSFSTPELMTADLLTQQAQIASPSTMLAVVDRLKLDTGPGFAIPSDVKPSNPLYAERGVPLEDAAHHRDQVLATFAAHLQVAIVKGTRLLEITYTDAVPSEASRIANAVVAAYSDASSQSRLQASSQASRGLADQLSTLKAKVESSQQQVEQYQKEAGLAGVTMLPTSADKGSATTSGSETIPVARLLAFNQDLTAAQVARVGKASIYRMAQTDDPEAMLGIPATLGGDAMFSPGGQGLALLANLREQLTQIDIQMASAATRYGPKSDTILELRNRDTAVRKEIVDELAHIRTRAKNDLDLATSSENGLRRQVASQEQLVTDWSSKVDHLLMLEGEAASSRTLYQDLYTRFQEANLARGINSTNIALLDPARTPSQPSSPKKLHDAALGFGVGCVLGIMCAFVLDYFDESLHSAQEIRRMISLPMLGAITHFPRARKQLPDGAAGARLGGHRPRLAAGGSMLVHSGQSCLVRDPRSQFAEAYRSARAALLKARASGSFRTLVVASGSDGEGRAAACFDLAVAFALLGDRVLFLDADMHTASPDGSGEKDGPGLSECLLDGRPLAEAVQQSLEAESLFLLPAGVPPANPSELIASRRFADLLNTARSQFDYVFINSPSALAYSDASILSSLADGYLLVLQSGKTQRQDLLRTVELLRSPRTACMGVLFQEAAPRAALPFFSKRQTA